MLDNQNQGMNRKGKNPQDITTTSGDLTKKYGIESLSIGDQKEYQYMIRFE